MSSSERRPKLSADRSVSFENDPLLSRNVADSNKNKTAASSGWRLQPSISLALSARSTELNQRLVKFLEEDETTTRGSESSSSSGLWRRITNIVRSSTTVTDVLKLITLSDRQEVLSRPGVGEAAFLICDSVVGMVENPAEGAYNPYINPQRLFRNALSVICRRVCSARPVVQTLHGAAWILLLLTFLEPPAWCDHHCYHGRYSHILVDGNHLNGCEAILSAKGIPASPTAVSLASAADNNNNNNINASSEQEEVLYYPNSHSMLLSRNTSENVEMISVGIIFLIILIRLGRDGLSLRTYLRAGPSQINRIIQLVCLVGISTAVFASSHDYYDFRVFNPFFRLALLTSFLPGVQRDLNVLMTMLPQVFNVLVVLGVFMTFYAWFGCVIFVGTDEGKQHFPNLIEALWTLWICVTTANYPDVMMPSYNNNRWTALYFVSFMLLSFFFLMNIILASVVNSHDGALQKRKVEQANLSTDNLKRAFKLLDPNGLGRIDRETVMGLFWILNEDFPECRTLSSEDTTLLFALLDKDGSNLISEEEFMDFGNVLLVEFTNTSAYSTYVERRFPTFYQSHGYQWFCRLVKSDYFERAIDTTLVLNAIVVGIQSYPELSGGDVDIDPKYYDGSIDTVWELVETIFTVIYLLEVIAKVLVIGWKRYIESTKNVFDFTITVMALASTAIVYYPNAFRDTRLIRMIVMLRVMRLLRLVLAVKRFQLIGAISAEILPASRSVVMLLFLLMYLFSCIGVHFLGGLITRDQNNKLAYLVLGTDFSDNEYWANNFNDMVSGMNVLFNLLVVNNWTNCEIGFEATTQSKWVRFFFLSYHIFGVILINNLVIAFIIDKFMNTLERFRVTVDDEVFVGEDAVIYHREAVAFEGSEITGTKTCLTGNYIARIRNPDKEGYDHDRLRKLFTQSSSVVSSVKGVD